jgi:hypothetical protein
MSPSIRTFWWSAVYPAGVVGDEVGEFVGAPVVGECVGAPVVGDEVGECVGAAVVGDEVPPPELKPLL